MDSRSLAAPLLTKRGVIVLLVASAGVLGAGFGYVFPALNDPPDGPVETGTTSSGPAGTTSVPTTASEWTATTQPSGETTKPSERGDDGTTAATSTTTTSASDASADDANWWYETDDDSEPSDSSDGDATVGVHAEANATVASFSSPTRAAVEG